MFSPAIRTNSNRANENAESVARKPGQSLLRKAFQDCSVNTPIAKQLLQKKALTALNSVTPNVVVPEAVFPEWAHDFASNKFVETEDVPDWGKIIFRDVKNPEPTPPSIDSFLFDIPTLDFEYYEPPPMEINLIPEEIPKPNFNDFAF